MTRLKVKTVDMKEYRKVYKSKIENKQRRRELVKHNKCECGGKYTDEHKTFHEGSRKHLRFLGNQLMQEPIEDFEHPPFETVDMTYFHVFDFDDIQFEDVVLSDADIDAL